MAYLPICCTPLLVHLLIFFLYVEIVRLMSNTLKYFGCRADISIRDGHSQLVSHQQKRGAKV